MGLRSPRGTVDLAAVAYAYSPDQNHNVIQVTRAMPGSPLSSLVTAYSYDAVFNKPVSITDYGSEDFQLGQS